MTEGIRRLDYRARDQMLGQRISAKAPVRHLDPILIFTTIALAAIGSVAVFSATRQGLTTLGLDEYFYLKRQLAFSAVALIVFVVTLLFDYRQLRSLGLPAYGLMLVLLLIVLTPLGEVRAGAQRWIGFGILQFQPSELMKVVLVMTIASLYADDRTERGFRRLMIALGLTALPALLIYFQPDLGTVMVCFAVLFSVLLLSGTRGRWLLLVLLAGVVISGTAVQVGVLKDYQVARLIAFLDNDADLQRAGYNLAQSKIAIGSGGLTGKGLFQGSQTNLDYVPEQHTDFIFTAIAEEKGFVGGIILLGFFSLLVWRSLRIAMISKDLFGTLLAGGIAGMFIFQVFVNVGMTLGIMPITGIPLPFVSYGGTSLITSFIAVGLLMNIHMRRFV